MGGFAPISTTDFRYCGFTCPLCGRGQRTSLTWWLTFCGFSAESTGVYYQREGAHNPVVYHYNKKKKSFQPAEEFPDHVFAPIDGCGFGFVWTSWKLIDAIARHKDFDPQDGWFPDTRDAGGFGEDLSFCAKAMACGIQLYVDTGIRIGHVSSPEVIYREDFLAAKEKLTEEEKKEKHLYGVKVK